MLGSFGDIVKEGWLEKQSKFFKSWRKYLYTLSIYLQFYQEMVRSYSYSFIHI